MASKQLSNPAEDQLSCSVCLDMLANPHELVCQHTFCLTCIQKLTQEGLVKCPECRTVTIANHVKKDFKTQRWLDLCHKKEIYVKRKENAEGGNIQCSICEEDEVYAAYHCSVCKQFMCKTCHKAHVKFKPKGHKVVPVENFIDQSKSILQGLQKMIQKEKNNMVAYKSTIDQKLKSVDHQKRNVLRQVDELRNQLISKIDNHCMNQKEVISNEFGKIKIQYLDAQEEYAASSQEIEERQRKVTEMLECNDSFALSEISAATDVSTRRFLSQIRSTFQKASEDVPSPVQVTEGIAWDPRSGPQIQVKRAQSTTNRPSCSNTNAGPSLSRLSVPSRAKIESSGQYAQVRASEYRKNKEVELEEWTRRMCLVRGQLWMCCNNDIIIYDENLNKVKEVHYGKSTSGTTHNALQGHVILSHGDDGLSYFTDTPPHNSFYIRDGHYADVFWQESSEKLYTLMYHPRGPALVVFTYTSTQHMYIPQEPVSIDYDNSVSFDKLWVHDSFVYVSSFVNHSVYKYSAGTGHLLETVQRSGEVCFPHLCGVDSFGNVMIADGGYDCVQVCVRGEWSNVRLEGGVVYPIQALVGEGGYIIWIISYNFPKYSISKFTKIIA